MNDHGDHRSFLGSHAMVRGCAAASGAVFLVLLARSVPPGPFALIAIGSAVYSAGALLVEFGAETALLQSGLTPRRQVAVLVAGLVVSVILPGSAWLLSSWMDQVFRMPGMGRFISLMLSILPFSVLQSPFRAAMLAQRRFKRVAIIEAIGIFVGFLAGTGFLLFQPSHEAFVVYLLAGHIARVLLFWGGAGTRPGPADFLAPDFSIFRTGKHIFASAFLTYLGKNLDDLILGLRAGPVAVSLYNLSYRVIQFQQEYVSGPLKRLALPVYSTAKDDRHEIFRLFCRDTELVFSLAAPMLTVAACESKALIQLALGAGWLPAVPVFRILCLEALRQSLLPMAGTAMVAAGAAKELARFSLVSTAVLVATFVLFSGQPIAVFSWWFFSVNTGLNAYFFAQLGRVFRLPLHAVVLQWIPGALTAGSVLAGAACIPEGANAGLRLLMTGAVALGASAFWYTMAFPRIGRTIREAVFRSRLDKGAAQQSESVLTIWTDVTEVGTNPHLGALHAAIGDRSSGRIRFQPLHVRNLLSDAWNRSSVLSHAMRIGETQLIHMHFISRLYDGVRAYSSLHRMLRSVVTLSLLRLRGMRFAITCHNHRAHDFPHRRLERLALYLLYAQCDLVLSLSQEGRKCLLLDCGYTDPIHVTPHPPYEANYADSLTREEAREELGIHDDEMMLLFFGSNKPYKGLEDALHAFRLIKNSKPLCLVVAGMEAREALEAREACGPGRRILVHDGFVQPDRVQVFMRAADAGLLPYRDILHSGTFMLFCTFGCPAIVPDLGWFPEIFAEYRLGQMYRAGDIGSLSDAIAAAARCRIESYADEMERFRNEHSLDVAVQSTMMAYRSMHTNQVRWTRS
jgi:O-antigen/teichoic acid export membrane protein/glycosyltransferase involved in cell wall biosynthesis